MERADPEEMVRSNGNDERAVTHTIVVDARQHMLLELASSLAKELLKEEQQRVVVVRCEEICLRGGLLREKMKYLSYHRKRYGINTKPSFTPPAKLLSIGIRRKIKDMVPQEPKRAAAARARFKAYEGVPPPYDKMKHIVVPDALRSLVLQPGRKYCLAGSFSREVNSTHYNTTKDLKEKRKEKTKVAKAADDTEKLGSQLQVLVPLKDLSL